MGCVQTGSLRRRPLRLGSIFLEFSEFLEELWEDISASAIKSLEESRKGEVLDAEVVLRLLTPPARAFLFLLILFFSAEPGSVLSQSLDWPLTSSSVLAFCIAFKCLFFCFCLL